MRVFSMTIGRLFCGSFRDFLDHCKFRGAKIEYTEGRGMLSRVFAVRGEDRDIEIVKALIKKNLPE